MDTKPRKKNSFLIIENDPNDAFLIKRALAAVHPGPSQVCRTVSEAKAYLQGAGMYADRSRYPLPAVVITDLLLGKESGMELVAWIREQGSPVKNLIVVILTGGASDLQWDAAQKVGAQKVYRKPARLEELQELLAGIARRSSALNPRREPPRASIK